LVRLRVIAAPMREHHAIYHRSRNLNRVLRIGDINDRARAAGRWRSVWQDRALAKPLVDESAVTMRRDVLKAATAYELG
jgi:hypothetical protein